jgi:RNA polymerase sigma-70 factor (ECF subfamily)
MLHAFVQPMTAASGDVDPLASLIAPARQGDNAALRSLLVAVGPAVLKVVRGMVGVTHPDLDDLVQESLLAFSKALASFRSESSVLHFARRVTVRQTAFVLRGARAMRRKHVAAALDDSIADAASSPHAAVLAKERMEIWHEVLSELPTEQTEALALKVLLGHSVEEIAAETNAPANTVRSRLRLAKDVLRQRLAGSDALAELEIWDDD